MNAVAHDEGIRPASSVRLLLLLAGDAPRSRRARANLDDAVDAKSFAHLAVHEVDVLREPREALRLGVFATPALVWTDGDAVQSVLYGDLSDGAALHRFLRGGMPS